MKLYLIGSLRNPAVPLLGNDLRSLGYEVIDTWWGAGPEADDSWQQYERIRGRSFLESLYDHYAEHIWSYDKYHLDTSDLGVMVHPVGRSAHIEFGYLIGRGKPAFVLFDKPPERFDVMYRFSSGVFLDKVELITALKELTSA